MKFTKDRVGPKEIFKWPVVGLLGLLNPPTVHWWIWRQKMRKCYSKFMVTTLANRAKSTRKILKYEIKYKTIMAIYIDKSTKNTRLKLDPAFFCQCHNSDSVTEGPPLPESLGRQIPQTSRSEGWGRHSSVVIGSLYSVSRGTWFTVINYQ